MISFFSSWYYSIVEEFGLNFKLSAFVCAYGLAGHSLHDIFRSFCDICAADRV